MKRRQARNELAKGQHLFADAHSGNVFKVDDLAEEQAGGDVRCAV